MQTINPIPYSQTASDYTGRIGRKYYAVSDPQELLDIAWRMYPRLLFQLIKLN